jgi:pimeloyl-ACP methyl ester carboxylesterase
MTAPRRHAQRAFLGAAVLVAVLAGGVPAASAQIDPPRLAWHPCEQAPGFQCATAEVPRDYARPNGAKIELAVTRLPARDPARRIGSLFFNPGGPGAPVVEPLHLVGATLFAGLNDRFDLVGFDPRGVGQSRPAIDCRVNQETEGLYAQPYPRTETLDPADLFARQSRYIRRCLDLNPGILPYVGTANVARDMDALRAALGEERLNYLGYSYGTYLGAVYANLFPRRYRALVLDSALDAEQWANDPLELGLEQAAGFERALGRFFQACAADKAVCPFGGADPHAAFDALLERLDTTPIPAGGPHPEPVNGDDLRAAALQVLYAKELWPILAVALSDAEAGDGTLIRLIVDLLYGRLPDGTYDPGQDRFFAVLAVDGRWPRDLRAYLRQGARAERLFEHFWFNSGYLEAAAGLYPVRDRKSVV